MSNITDIYNAHFNDVYKYIFVLCKNEALAEDITQDTFFKALKNIDAFNGTCKMRVWLCQIAKNTYFTYLKKEKNQNNMAGIEDVYFDKIEQNLINTDTAFQIHKQLHKLEEPYKEVFTLRLFGELSFAQIAELFEKTESWARVTYYRAKIKLKETL